MRAKRIRSDEQYRLIMECRSSGMSDHQWCLEHGINPSTFYSWLKRLRQKGCADLPFSSNGRNVSIKQDVVRIDFPSVSYDWPDTQAVPVAEPMDFGVSAMELSIANATVRIPNGTDPALLEQLVRILEGLPC